MKKNKIMRFASAIMVMTLLSTCMVGGTFAKYVTSAEGSDSARVAYWGFGQDGANDLVINDLFSASYVDQTNGTTVQSSSGDVIAPGTSGSADFAFKYTSNSAELGAVEITAPEVAYDFDVVVTAQNCDQAIAENDNIKWYLDDPTKSEALTWSQLVAKIGNLGVNATGGSRYEANTLPAGFGANDTHTISWEWVFTGADPQDADDTAMGNAGDLDDVSITITITATQID